MRQWGTVLLPQLSPELHPPPQGRQEGVQYGGSTSPPTTVLVSCGSWNKLPQICWFKKQVYSLSQFRSQKSKTKVSARLVPSGSSEGGSVPGPSHGFWWLPQSLPPTSATVFTWPSSLSLCVFPQSYKDTCHWIEGPS